MLATVFAELDYPEGFFANSSIWDVLDGLVSDRMVTEQAEFAHGDRI